MHPKRLLLALALLVLPAVLVACGGSGSSSSSTPTSTGVVTIPSPPEARHEPMAHPTTAQIAQHCPVGSSSMGCAQQAIPQQHALSHAALPNLPLFPDVYEGQGTVNWGAVASWQRSHGWHPAAIFKMGEFRLDHQAVRNAQQTRALGFWRAGYVFVRNRGCATEIANTEQWAHELGLRIVVEDDEVPEARGYAACMTPALERAGLIVIEYSSPGSNPDSGNPHVQHLWVAAYGPPNPPCLFTCSVGQLDRQSIVAWQMTDGQFGRVTSIPGLSRGDVSMDFGVTKLGAAAPKPPPPPPKWTTGFTNRTCFNRGFDVHWLRVHHRAVTAWVIKSVPKASRAACNAAFNSGWRAVR